MSDFLAEFTTEVPQQQPQQQQTQQVQQQPQQTQSYQQPQTSYNNQNKQSGGWGGGGDDRSNALKKWQEEQRTVQPLYLPVVVYFERDYPQEVTNMLVEKIGVLVNKGYTIRFNGEDFALFDRLCNTYGNMVEAHLPFSPFNNRDSGESRESKFKNNNATTDHLAQRHYGFGWDKLPKLVKILLSRNARMLLGKNNQSPAKALILWSKDGASKANQVSHDTGRVGNYIKVACDVAVPVFNLGSQESANLLNEQLLSRGNANE